MKTFDRSRAETWMQSERHVRRQLGFMISKFEQHSQFVSLDLISEVHADLQRIFAWGEILWRNLVFQRSAAPLCRITGEMPCFRAKKTVLAAFDFVSAV